jgi:oxygen-independent coproporphyrinogen-3 oxidase
MPPAPTDAPPRMKGPAKSALPHGDWAPGLEKARLYERTWDELAAAGYAQYEVSNFARPGHTCAHNLNTWNMHEWVGVGPSAAGQHDGWRGANPADLELWGQRVANGLRMGEDRVALTPGLLLEDALLFGLRLNGGVDLDALEARFGIPAGLAEPRATLRRLAEQGLIEPESVLMSGEYAPRLTRRGRLLADGVGSELVGLLS